MTCIRFPRQSSQEIYELLFELRELFGRERVSTEDQIRLESIRASAKLREASSDSEGFSEALLEQAESELLLSLQKNPGDGRALELLNKTNQFNLNGKRFTDAEWNQFLSEEDTFLVTASYQDRFGPLGKIAVIAGRRNGEGVEVDSWVMSCRAFARRIEHQCLRFLFDTFNCDSISFDYQRTPKNGPLGSFFSELSQKSHLSRTEISKERFEAVCPRLFHRVREV
jgi:FkbH-like protein